LSLALTGVAGTAAVGTVTGPFTISLSGVSGTGAVGTVVASGADVPVVAPTGKYQSEHDSALVDLGSAHGFASEHAGALTDLGAAKGFSSEHGSALKDLGDAGI